MPGVWDRGVRLMPSRSQMSYISRIDNSCVLSVMISWILFPDPFSAATLNTSNASTTSD